MIERLDARQRWVVVVEGGVPVYAGITPAAGCAYKIIAAYGYHEEGANLNCYWTIDVGDGVGYTDLSDAAALGSGVKAQLYTNVPTRESLVLMAGMQLRFVALLKTNTKNVAIRALVEEIRGFDTYGA